MGPNHLLLPMKLDAFVFNPKVCEGDSESAKIAPITQPNYTFLRLQEHLAQHDILDPVDLYNSSPGTRNPRLTDIGKAETRANRLGVYVHWSLPRPFRQGLAATTSAAPSAKDETSDPTAPSYQYIPNRWLVVRSLDPQASTTKPQGTSIPSVTAWVVESDKTRSIDKLGLEVDLEVDVAPFITSYLAANSSAEKISVDEQAEIFIGSCTPAQDWVKPLEEEPSVQLTAGSSSNQLFIDYQYHNGNVFSMLDTFAYEEGGVKKNLESAVASYYVIGWQSDEKKDIMSTKNRFSSSSPSVNDEAQSRSDRLGRINVTVNETIPMRDAADIAAWLKSPDSALTLCHGVMYDVEWDISSLPESQPANQFARHIAKEMPLAVGSTSVDALLAYISTHHPEGSIEDCIWGLQALLRGEDDSVDGQIAAMDEIQSNNYGHFDGGNVFYLPAEEGGKPPSDTEQEGIRASNNAQHFRDAGLRRTQQLRWDIFSWWFKYISDVDNVDGARDGWYKDQINIPKSLLDSLKTLDTRLGRYIGSPAAPIKTGVMETFHQRSDPTLVVGGLESGWPQDFNKTLRGRLDDQTIEVDIDVPTASGYERLPESLQSAAKSLVAEFLALRTATDPKQPPPKDRVPPLYHDGKSPSQEVSNTTNPWRDRFNNSQPWFPLYLEWEVEYAHIDFDAWSMTMPLESKVRPELASKISYVLNKDVQYQPPAQERDQRTVSGRVLILPQPSFSIKAYIERIFNITPKNPSTMSSGCDDRQKLLEQLDGLAILSVPLAGLSDHLATRFQGSHIKPLVREPGKKPVLINDVAKQAKDIGITGDILTEIEKESDPTPYGSLSTLVGHFISGFKPVTHGQMRFTKLNVVDKFGQVVHAIDPMADQPPPIYPSTGDLYAINPSFKDKDKPNVVDPIRSPAIDVCEYIQLPPSINQPTRINSHFVVRNTDEGAEQYWRPVTEFDNPIWGWVVVNYVDNGLQFFLPDGTFYREVRVTEGTQNDLKWLPFEPPNSITASRQLDALLNRFLGADGQTYLKSFKDMTTSALSATVPAPSAYSQFLNSLVGRPLALANMGWSLELNTLSQVNQSTLQEQMSAKLARGLLPGDGLKLYEFPIKFGDAARNYDGLIGYFQAPNDNKNALPDPASSGNDLVLDQIYTYYTKDEEPKGSPLKRIIDGDYTKFNTYWLNPLSPDYSLGSGDKDEIKKAALKFETDRNRKLKIFGAIFDPFVPITGYSSILPIRTLKLGPWTWEGALKRITTFFHAGPILMTKDVPDFLDKYKLKQNEKDGKYSVSDSVPDAQLSMPALKAADWAWLQPYDLDNTAEPTAFMSVEVVGDSDETPRWEKGPLTATEGYLQLKAPIEQGKAQ